jgi:hypothetical protein
MNPERIDPLQKPIIQAKIQMLRDQRTAKYAQLKEIQAAQLDPVKQATMGPDQSAQILKDLDQNYKDETDLLTGALGKAPAEPAAGTGTITTQRVPNESERNILDILKDQGVTLPSWQPQTTSIGGGPPAPVYTDGHVIKNPTTGEMRIMQNGQWMPYQQSGAAQ